MKEKLKSLKAQLIELTNQKKQQETELNQVDQQISQLLQLEEVKNFLTLSENRTDLLETIGELENLIRIKSQQNCPHPLYYLHHTNTDSYEVRSYYDIECVACGKVERDRRSIDGINLIYHGRGIPSHYRRIDIPINTIRKEYQEAITSQTPKKAAKILVKKYCDIWS